MLWELYLLKALRFLEISLQLQLSRQRLRSLDLPKKRAVDEVRSAAGLRRVSSRSDAVCLLIISMIMRFFGSWSTKSTNFSLLSRQIGSVLRFRDFLPSLLKNRDSSYSDAYPVHAKYDLGRNNKGSLGLRDWDQTVYPLQWGSERTRLRGLCMHDAAHMPRSACPSQVASAAARHLAPPALDCCLPNSSVCGASSNEPASHCS